MRKQRMIKVSLMEHRERDDPSRKMETFDGIAPNLLLKLNLDGQTRKRSECRALQNINSCFNGPFCYFVGINMPRQTQRPTQNRRGES